MSTLAERANEAARAVPSRTPAASWNATRRRSFSERGGQCTGGGSGQVFALDSDAGEGAPCCRACFTSAFAGTRRRCGSGQTLRGRCGERKGLASFLILGPLSPGTAASTYRARTVQGDRPGVTASLDTLHHTVVSINRSQDKGINQLQKEVRERKGLLKAHMTQEWQMDIKAKLTPKTKARPPCKSPTNSSRFANLARSP